MYKLQKLESGNVGVSVIVDFNDYQFFDVRNTVDSCLLLHTTSLDLVTELIAVDDGSTLDYVIEESQRYFSSVPKARLLRTGTERLGSVQARAIGFSQAAADHIVVFLESTVICSVGWLEPLLYTLSRHPDALVTPHYDRVKDPVSLEYQLQTPRLWPVCRGTWQ